MNITFYGYNTFVIKSGEKKLAIDPGALFLYYFRLTTLIPKTEWNEMTHIFVTHGDPDHHWHTDRVAEASGAPVICNTTMVRNINGRALVLGPRNKGLAFTTPIKKLHTMSVDETIQLDGMSITGLKATHGPLTLKVGPFSKAVTPGPEERIGWGSLGFKIQVHGKTVVNLADTLLHLKEWASIKNPDVLMIPIGGREAHNTMDEAEALQVVRMMEPKLVIPCHYNLPQFFTKKYCAADDTMFKKEVEKTGARCVILHENESIDI